MPIFFLRVDKAFRETAKQAALERGVLERAMQQQIGITTDRRGEMRVMRQRQTEMADVGRAVARLHQRTQQYRLDQADVGPRFELGRAPCRERVCQYV